MSQIWNIDDVTENDLKIRYQEVGGVGEWVWPVKDEGAWDGPSKEFEEIKNHIMRHVRARGVIVQAGGCCGMYPRLFSNYFDKVYTFEPSPYSFYCLLKNCPDERIIKYNAALGYEEKEVYLCMTSDVNVGMNTITEDTGLGMPVQQMTVDGLKLEACDAIQFDLEGYEPSALLGAERTITTFHPVVSLEVRSPTEASVAILEQWGYREVGRHVSDVIFAVPKG